MSTPAPAWSLTDAKARFSELVGTAEREGPQTIMRRGQPTVVVVAMDE